MEENESMNKITVFICFILMVFVVVGAVVSGYLLIREVAVRHHVAYDLNGDGKVDTADWSIADGQAAQILKVIQTKSLGGK